MKSEQLNLFDQPEPPTWDNVDGGKTVTQEEGDDYFRGAFEALIKERGKKDTKGKSPVDLLPFDVLLSVATTLGYGAKKYGAHNYRDGIAYSKHGGAALRHIFKWFQKEEVDDESGLHHLDHAISNLLMLRWTTINKSEMDDRL